MSEHYEMDLGPVAEEEAGELAGPLLEQAKQELGFVPKMYAHMAQSPGLLSTYLHGYEQFREQSHFSAAEQEVVFLSISAENGCHYCVAAHSTLADGNDDLDEAVIDSVRDGRELPDKKLGALSHFCRHMVQTRGRPEPNQARQFLEAGYRDHHILDIVLAIGVKTLSNYANHVLNTEVDEAFSPRQWTPQG